MTEDEARLSADLTARALPPGSPAPEFSLETVPGQKMALSERRGQPVVLAFYPGDWTPVCNDQLVELSARIDAFGRRGAALLAISVDSAWSHAAFAAARNLRMPLVADFHPKGAVARAYGVWSEEWGTSERALFVLDGAGVIRWRLVVPAWVNPGVEEVLTALDALVEVVP